MARRLLASPHCLSSSAASATAASDLTVIIGDASTPTTVNNLAGDGVNMNGVGAQTLTIVNAGSLVKGTADGADVYVTGGAGGLAIDSAGEIYGAGRGIRAINYGSGGGGATTITVNDVTGKSAEGVYIASQQQVTVDGTAGDIVGATDGIYARTSDGVGVTVQSDGNITGQSGAGVSLQVGRAGGVDDLVIDTSGGAAVDATSVGGGSITVDTSAGTVSGGTTGVSAGQSAGAPISIKVDDVSGGVGVKTRGRGGVTVAVTWSVIPCSRRFPASAS